MNAVDIKDAEIRAYLLGSVEAGSSDKIDELAFVDSEFATRIDVVERDLVDEYQRNELDADELGRFESHYLRSPLRRERAGFGGSFRAYLDSAGVPANRIRADTGIGTQTPWFTAWWKFGFAAAAAAILVAVGIPLWYNSSTQQANNPPVNSAPNSKAANAEIASSNSDPVQAPIVPDPRPTDGTSENTNVKPSPDNKSTVPRRLPSVFALNLSPQLRGGQGEKRVSLPTAADSVAVTLRLEPTDFSSVRVELKELSTSRVIWQSRLRPTGSADSQSVRLSLPTRLFSKGRYTFTVSGLAQNSEPEIIGDYPFTVVP